MFRVGEEERSVVASHNAQRMIKYNIKSPFLDLIIRRLSRDCDANNQSCPSFMP